LRSMPNVGRRGNHASKKWTGKFDAIPPSENSETPELASVLLASVERNCREQSRKAQAQADRNENWQPLRIDLAKLVGPQLLGGGFRIGRVRLDHACHHLRREQLAHLARPEAIARQVWRTSQRAAAAEIGGHGLELDPAGLQVLDR
jgi:hypothetical protein